MAIRKYLNWKGWFEGLYLTWVKNLTQTLIAVGGTNAAESLGWKGIGLNWEQGIGILASITFWEIIKYLNAKPLPETVTETFETTTITSSKTTTTENK